MSISCQEGRLLVKTHSACLFFCKMMQTGSIEAQRNTRRSGAPFDGNYSRQIIEKRGGNDMITERITKQSRMDAQRLYEFLSDCSGTKTADFILVLGCHDLRVPDHAAELFLSGAAPLVLCTGGFGKMTEGYFHLPEGVLFARRCVEKGVPPDAILVEDKATNTGENFALSRALISGKKTGIAVCKPYMAKRALATGEKQWSEIQWSVSTPQIPFAQYVPDDDALIPEIELMTGDLQRLEIYARRGFQAPTFVPEEIWAAWRRLVDAGFDRYVIK